MKLHFSLDELHGIRNPVVTTGTFDGVHVGHKAIIRRIKKLAQDIDGESVLITFHPHPRRVLYPETAGRDLLMILSQKEKIELLGKTGLDHLVILEFTKEFSRISSHDFVEKILAGILHAKIIVIGFNHQFGYHREGDFEYLKKLSIKYGFRVEEIPEQDIQNESVSSTKIRESLLTGNIQRANAYLDHHHIIKNRITINKKSSIIYGMSVYSVNIEEDTKLVPPDGVYAISLTVNKSHHKGMLMVSGWELTKNHVDPALKVEVSFFDDLQNLDGMEVTILFHKKIRDISTGESPSQMKKHATRDRQEIENLIF